MIEYKSAAAHKNQAATVIQEVARMAKVDPGLTKNIGLRGITVADTKISFVDGDNGALYYRGYTIGDLAKYSTFEETAFLLMRGRLPSKKELHDYSSALAAERDIPDGVVHTLLDRPKESVPMDVLQSAIPMLAHYDPNLRDDSREANLGRATALTAKTATLVAHWNRIRQGLSIVKPDAALSHAANFLYMMTGKKPDPKIAKIMDTCLVLHADHTFNASTFAAREVASTRAHMYAAVSAAVGALSGELHGGANARVMEMLERLGSVSKVDAFVKAELAAGRRIFGMGHAVYRTNDPRALVLGPMSESLGKLTGQEKWYRMSLRVMETTQKEIKRTKGMDIFPNVDFFSASVYHVMGIDIPFFTPVFAVSRVAGWTAHVIEEKFSEAQPKPMLYRPKAEYVGAFCAPEGCTYVPLEKRK